MFACRVLCLLTLALAPLPAFAQATPDGTLSHSHTHAGGEIDEVQPPLLFEVTYTAEIDSNVAGGLERATRYLDNLDLVLEADLARLAGWKGAMVHVYGLYNNGTSFSPLVGDAQVTSNIETGVQAFRLYEAWIAQDLGKAVNLKLGLYDLNSEFDSLDAGGVFTSSAHGIGTDISQSGVNGPSIFPVTSLAARLDVKPAEGWHLRGAVLDGVPGDPARPAATVVRLSKADGALLIGEVEAPVAGGKLLLGHWRYTAPQEMLAGGKAKGSDGVYFRGEVPLLGSDNGRRLDGFFRLGWADGKFSAFEHFASLGFSLSAPFARRPDDQLGLAVAAAFVSDAARAAQGSGSAPGETSVELTYRAQMTPWLSLQPNLHYVINPGADRGIPDALILGLRASVSARPFGD